MNPKISIVDTGGFRGVYAAGALDYCMHKGLMTPVASIPSAGILTK